MQEFYPFRKNRSKTHAHLQKLLFDNFHSSCVLEHSFPTINRRADVYLPNFQLVIEIQLSPISDAELASRIHDYQSLSLCPVFLFSSKFDTPWNRKRFSKLNLLHYFIQFNGQEDFFIYDRIFIHFFQTLPPKKIDLYSPQLIRTRSNIPKLPYPLSQRTKHPIYFSKDYLDLAISQPAYLELVKSKLPPSNLKKRSFYKDMLFSWYWSFFNKLLKSFCK